MATEKARVGFDERHLAELRLEAKRRGVTLSSLIRAAIAVYMGEKANHYNDAVDRPGTQPRTEATREKNRKSAARRWQRVRELEEKENET